MPHRELSQIPQEELLTFCSRSLYTLDGLWFVTSEEEHGFEKALELDIEVWNRLTRIQAKRVQEFFAVEEDNPLQAVMSIMSLDPLLTVFKIKVVELTENKVVFRFTDCPPPQKARLRDGKPEMSCQKLGLQTYQAYADVVDPGIRLSCRHCPPDLHPPDYWCEWQFER
ncbi:DUF6125 family protein [Chloroflexota bacterium]